MKRRPGAGSTCPSWWPRSTDDPGVRAWRLAAPARRLYEAFAPGPLTVALGFSAGRSPPWLAGRVEVGVRIPGRRGAARAAAEIRPAVRHQRERARAGHAGVPRETSRLDGAPDAGDRRRVSPLGALTLVNCNRPEPGGRAQGRVRRRRRGGCWDDHAVGSRAGHRASCDDTDGGRGRRGRRSSRPRPPRRTRIHGGWGASIRSWPAGRTSKYLPTVAWRWTTRVWMGACARSASPGGPADRALHGRAQHRGRARHGVGGPGDRGEPPARASAQRRPGGEAGAGPRDLLLVSGGHSFLARMDEPGDIELHRQRRGTTDRRCLRQGRPHAGAGLSRRAGGRPAGATGMAVDPPSPGPLLAEGLEFSFSGLKSAVSRLGKTRRGRPRDVAASFVAACMEVLTVECPRARGLSPSASLVVVGGVRRSPQLARRAPGVLRRARRRALPAAAALVHRQRAP